MKRIIVSTDGSAIMNENGNYDSAYAFVIFKGDEIIKEESGTLLRHTNNYAEMYAIYKATKYLLESKISASEIEEIVIVTDSELCLNSLTVWMKGWLKKSNNEKLFNSKGELVKNQELIKSAFINILMINPIIPVKLYHINSHKPESEIQKMYNKFSKENSNITMDEFRLIYNGNQLCDKMAYNELNKK